MSGCSGPSAFSRMASARSQERLGLGVGAGGLVQHGQIVERGGGVGMLGAERLLANGERALVERLGLRVGTGALVQPSEIVERAWRCRDARGRAPSHVSRARAGRAARPSHRRPVAWYSKARLLSERAVSGCSGPSAFSMIASARSKSGSALA